VPGVIDFTFGGDVLIGDLRRVSFAGLFSENIAPFYKRGEVDLRTSSLEAMSAGTDKFQTTSSN
jgi:hypothetical protein